MYMNATLANMNATMDIGIAQVMMWFLEAAAEQKRDAARLRFILWLTFDLLRELKALLESLMLQFSRQVHRPIGDIMILVQAAYKDCGGHRQSGSRLKLFQGFSDRSSLPRPVHFLDMILPQLSPVHTRWDDASESRCSAVII